MEHAANLVQTTKRWLNQRSRFFRLAGLSLAAIILLVVTIQLAYPAEKLRPNTSLQNVEVGGQTTSQATAKIKKAYEKAQVSITLGDASTSVGYKEIGINIDEHSAIKQAANYPTWQRLIPFSFFAPVHKNLTATYDDAKIEYFAKKLAKEHSRPATNASIRVEGDDIKLVPARKSEEFKAGDVSSSIYKAVLDVKSEISVSAVSHQAARNDSAVKKAVEDAKKVIDAPFVLELQAEEITVDKKTVASWLDFPENKTTGSLELSVNTEAVKQFITSLQPKVYKAPGETKVSLYDGQEISRTSGESGLGLDIDGAVAEIAESIKSGNMDRIVVSTKPIAPRVVYDRQYSDTQAGLAALVKDVSGDGMSIAVIEVGNKKRVANFDGGKQLAAASTYKLFVAYAVIKRVESGAMKWSDVIVSGKTAEACFEAMIVVSDNPCAEAFGKIIGWQNIENMMKGIGLSATVLARGTLTTSNDLSFFLRQLQAGTLLSQAGTERLVGAMQRQIYRSGIPTGTGVAVADKVGFLDEYLHDAAIVYGPKGPYILVIMSKNSSWGAIAKASNQIHNYLNR